MSTDESKMWQGLIQVYEKAFTWPELSSREREVIADMLSKARAEVSVVLAKRMFGERNYRGAAVQLESANAYYDRLNLRLAEVALKAAGKVTQWLHATKRRSLY
jgi:hypothetical protein